jgi:predicted metal-binding membrane protein
MAAVLEDLLRRDRAVVFVALSAITLLAWAYTLRLAAAMDMGGMSMSGYRMATGFLTMVMAPSLQPWDLTEFMFTALMWAVMMVGMMTPSVAPMVLLYARVGRQAALEGRPLAATGWFALGYFLSWCAFSMVAALAQWALERAALLTHMMAGANIRLGGVVLIVAGAYQWTPAKDTCLRFCQAPLSFIQRHGGFRRTAAGSMGLGMRHGFYCIGCCWALMTLLFVGGVMNLLWIAALAILVLAEKLIPLGRVVARVAGGALIVAGCWLLLAPAPVMTQH